MAAQLEELVRLVAYTFYDEEYTMVLTALLEVGRQITVDEFSTQLKLRNRDLSTVLSRLKQDGLVAVESRPDYSGVEDPDSLTEYKRRQLQRDYYSLDFKSFVDSVHLKILRVREHYARECGPEDRIFYECPRCKEEDGGMRQGRKKYIYKLPELVACCTDDGDFVCPACQNAVVELDDTDEVNSKKRDLQEFVLLTDPLLDLIRQTKGLVLIDDPDVRCQADQMMPVEEYRDEKEKILEEKKRLKQIRQDHSPQRSRPGAGQEVNLVVQIQQGVQPIAVKTAGAEERKALEKEDQQKLAAEQERSRKTINVRGVEYTADQITNKLVDSLDDDEFEKVMRFKQDYS
jgi:transcription initiation factor IIE alpha subunit